MRGVVAAVLFVAAALVVARPVTSQTGGVYPAYGALQVGAPVASKADVARIIELLEQIERNTAGGPAAVKAKGPDLSVVAKKYCAACHTPAKADEHGHGFILFADDKASALKPLSGGEKTLVRQKIQDGTMPPGRKMSDAEKTAFRP